MAKNSVKNVGFQLLSQLGISSHDIQLFFESALDGKFCIPLSPVNQWVQSILKKRKLPFNIKFYGEDDCLCLNGKLNIAGQTSTLRAKMTPVIDSTYTQEPCLKLHMHELYFDTEEAGQSVSNIVPVGDLMSLLPDDISDFLKADGNVAIVHLTKLSWMKKRRLPKVLLLALCQELKEITVQFKKDHILIS